MAIVTGAELIRLQCYEEIEASQALYDWDFARQILHIRAVEATAKNDLDASTLEESLFRERFLLERPILKALRSPRAVLLIDEIDRADDGFEAFLLEVLSTSRSPFRSTERSARQTLRWWCSPPTGRGSCTTPSNDAASTTGSIIHSSPVRSRSSGSPTRGERPPGGAGGGRRSAHPGERRHPRTAGVAESLDWARALHRLGHEQLDVATAAETLGAVLKYREDAERTRRALAAIVARSRPCPSKHPGPRSCSLASRRCCGQPGWR